MRTGGDIMDLVTDVLSAAVSVPVSQRTISSATGSTGLREGAYMVTNALNSPHIVRLLDRLFDEADGSEPSLEAVAQSDASRLLTSRTEYGEFYGLLKNIPLPVRRDNCSICSRVQQERGMRWNSVRRLAFRQFIWPHVCAITAVVESSRQSSNRQKSIEPAQI